MFSFEASATHLIGSDMYYTYMGNDNYQITLKVYRECGPANTQGTDFDDQIVLGVFNMQNNSFIDEYNVFLNKALYRMFQLL